jgi:hypothetical protein
VPYRPIRRPALANRMGEWILRRAERLPPDRLARLRAMLWRFRVYLVVRPGETLIDSALDGFPDEVRAIGRTCRFRRFDARGGGGYYADRGEIWLAAGVETYEGLRQVVLSSRHELFHHVCHTHPRYRLDEARGLSQMRRAVAASRPLLHSYPRYRDWVVGSFLPQGDHANPVEYFADIPTNFRDAAELPPPLRAYFAPLIEVSPLSIDLERDRPEADPALSAFHRSLSPV